MKALAIDPGTRCGWATDATGRLEWGCEDFSLARGESSGMRFVKFNRWLYTVAGKSVIYNRVGLVVYEQPHLRGGAATEVLVGMVTRIQEFCVLNGVEHAAVHSATLKKYALGRGRGSKEEMIEAAVIRAFIEHIVPTALQPVKLSEHEADALWLYWYTQAMVIGAAGKSS